MPSFLLISLLDLQNKNTIIFITISKLKSIIDSKVTVIELITAATPIISVILKIFEPITFPRAISFSPFFDATKDVTSSGRLVPTATTVRPIKV